MPLENSGINQVEGLGCLHPSLIARSGLALLEHALNLPSCGVLLWKWGSGDRYVPSVSTETVSIGLPLSQRLSRSRVDTKVAQSE